MFGRFKRKILMLVAVVFIAGAAMIYQAYDLKAHYSLVDARITSIKIDCYIKAGKEKVVNKSKKLAYMDCKLAPYVALKNGMDKKAVHKRATVEYRFRSPVDNSFHKGTYTREENTDQYRIGKKIRVHAHRKKADVSRTSNGNMFIEDTGA